jgi:PAS domain S-box-containing protein
MKQGAMEPDGPDHTRGTAQERSRQQVEQALKQSEQRFRETADLLPSMICELDLDANVTYANRLAFETTGLTPEHMRQGVNVLRDIVAPEDRERARLNLQAVVAGRPTGPSEYRLRTATGVELLAMVSSSPMTRDGRVVGIRTSINDVTEQRRLQAQLAQADRMASVGLLAAGVGHEINNPLTYTLYNLETLREGLPNLARALERLRSGDGEDGRVAAEAAELLSDLQQQVEDALDGAVRVRSIVRDLRTFSHVDTERVQRVSLNDVVQSALTMAHTEIKYRARLVKDLGDLPSIKANEAKLAQVVLNLVVNAAHSIDEGDVEHNEIRLRTWNDDRWVAVEVSDTGCGIAEEHLPHLFEPFYTTKEAGLGSGLGLSICSNIVAAYDGDIQVRSRPGKGTWIQVRLPLGPDAGREEAPVSGWEDDATSPGDRGRFLIVDDEPQICEAMRRALELEHRLEIATSGAAAQELLGQDQQFDGIICDLMMPRISGMELYDWLSQRYPGLAEGMIFITGGTFTPRARAFLRRINNPRFEKPLEMQVLRTLLRERMDRLRRRPG